MLKAIQKHQLPITHYPLPITHCPLPITHYLLNMTHNYTTNTQIPWNQEDTDEEDYFDYFYDQPGSEPGTIMLDPKAIPSTIILTEYTPEKATRQFNVMPHDCEDCINNHNISWVDIQGLGTHEYLIKIAEIFKLHPLLLEDVVNVPQRPKIEDYKDKLLIIAHYVTPTYNEDGFVTQQVGFVLGKEYLVTFQEDKNDCFNPVGDRLKIAKGKLRTSGVDYLTYLLLDAIIDSYFPVLEDYGERIEDLEDRIILNPSKHTLQDVYDVRRELLSLRRSIWPLRNVLNILIRDDNDLISADVQIYLRDCYDHVIQILDIIETYRELASSLMDVYLSSMSNKMNEVMNVLTIISTIFIPLTFIAGVYGMNFENMPELSGQYNYFICLIVMLLIGIGSIIFFKKRGWFNLFSQKLPVANK